MNTGNKQQRKWEIVENWGPDHYFQEKRQTSLFFFHDKEMNSADVCIKNSKGVHGK